MAKTAIISFDNTRATLQPGPYNSDLTNKAYKALSYEIPGSQWAGKGKRAGFGKPRKASFFSISTWSFPAGLIFLVREAFEKAGYEVELVDKRDGLPIVARTFGPSSFSKEIESCLKGITLRDYQVGAVSEIFSRTRGIIRAATGSGKTEISIAAMKLARDCGIKSLLLTHKVELLHQTADRIEKYTGSKVGVIGDGEMDLRDMTVATVETIDAVFRAFRELQEFRKAKMTREEIAAGIAHCETTFSPDLPEDKKKEYEEKLSYLLKLSRIAARDPEKIITKHVTLKRYLESVGLYILDEAHRGSGSQFQETIKAMPNAYYRIGVTATPWMKTDLENLKLAAVTGEVIYEVSVEDLVKRDLLAKPLVKFIRITEPVLPKSWKYPKVLKAGIIENTPRNKRIIEETFKLVAAGCRVLILVEKIEHGQRLFRALDVISGDLIRCAYIHGSKSGEERQKAIKGIGTGEINVLISSTILDEGVDAPDLSAVILAGGGKSSIKTYQRIGRGMRNKKDGPNEVYIVDFVDFSHKYLTAHSLERFQAIRNEPGYTIVNEFPLSERKVA